MVRTDLHSDAYSYLISTLVYSPGRFFAVNELKALMSYVLMNFDVKMDRVPSSMWFSANQFPNQSSKVLFRRRACIS